MAPSKARIYIFEKCQSLWVISNRGKRANSTCFHWGLHISQWDSSLFVCSSKSTLWFISPVKNAYLAPDIVTCTCAHTIIVTMLRMSKTGNTWCQPPSTVDGGLRAESESRPRNSKPVLSPLNMYMDQPGTWKHAIPIHSFWDRAWGSAFLTSSGGGWGCPAADDASSTHAQKERRASDFLCQLRFRVPRFPSNNLTPLIPSFLIQRKYKYSTYPSLGHYPVSWEEAFKCI